MSDNRAYQDARKNKEPKMMVNVPIDHTTSRLSKAAKHLRFCTDEEGNIWAMPVVGYRYDPNTGQIVESAPVPARQPVAYALIPNPASGVFYPVLDTSNARVRVIGANCTWTVQPTPITIRATIDGIVHTLNQTNPVSGTAYYWSDLLDTWGSETTLLAAANAGGSYKAFLFECKRLIVEVAVTGGTVSQLQAQINWDQF